MAAGKQKKQGEAVETREKTTKKKDPCLGCDLDCTKCEVNGAKTLRRAACKTLKQDSELITQELASKAKTGDANCAKLLLLLTESQAGKEGGKKKKHGGKSAQALAEEPEWSEEEEVVEAFTVPIAGNREPDG
jgi:hypothetical protein